MQKEPEEEKTPHLHVQFHTAAIPDALEMLSFLPR